MFSFFEIVLNAFFNPYSSSVKGQDLLIVVNFLILFFSPFWGLILILCLPNAYKLTLSIYGVETTFLFKKYFYAWDEVEEFIFLDFSENIGRQNALVSTKICCFNLNSRNERQRWWHDFFNGFIKVNCLFDRLIVGSYLFNGEELAMKEISGILERIRGNFQSCRVNQREIGSLEDLMKKVEAESEPEIEEEFLLSREDDQLGAAKSSDYFKFFDKFRINNFFKSKDLPANK